MSRKDAPTPSELHESVDRLMHYFRNAMPVPHERRRDARVQFIYPIVVLTADGRRLQSLSRDLSRNGMRLLSSRSLAGQRIRVTIPHADKKADSWCFTMQILWSTSAGDGLFDSGGLFVALDKPEEWDGE